LLAPSLTHVEVVQLLALNPAAYARAEDVDHLRVNAFFIGPGIREAVNGGFADYTPVFLGEIPSLFHGDLLLDVALVHVSPPDEHGYCSFGVSVDVSKPAAEAARVVVAQVNRQMPRTHGDSFIHVSQIDHVVERDEPIVELPPAPIDDVQRKIGEHVATLVDDGATLQLGIGGVPNAVLQALRDHHDLGVHSEMISDGVMELFEAGVITNKRKTLHRGKIVTSFVMGSRRFYDFLDNNAVIEMRASNYTNDPVVIARNDNMVAINSAISVDLTGQVNSDSIGLRFYSGFGGQVDFVRGAARAAGGKSIIAIPARAKHMSRIVPTLETGAGVVTSRADVHYVVTEFGAAQLHGTSIRGRTQALINIAHPEFREELTRFAREHRYL
jgi:acyl-CoA hydrolase